MNTLSLEKWCEFAPDLEGFTPILAENGYTDESLQLLDPLNNQRDWEEFIEVIKLTLGAKLIFKDRLDKFLALDPNDSVLSKKREEVKKVLKIKITA